MSEKLISGHIGNNIETIPVSDFLHDRYLTFAYYSIQDRALIASDGLKPVQRRTLYYMWQHNIKSNRPHIKAQKVAGSVSGELHPHGDCVRGDTKFLLSNGEYKTIEEMYKETQENSNKSYEVYSFNEHGDIEIGILTHARIGQYSKEIYNIELSNGEVIRVTSNHPFRLCGGQYIKAENLEIGMKLSSGTLKDKQLAREIIADDRIGTIKVNRILVDYLKEDQPMYDFTVEGYENAMVYFPETNSMISVHNSSVSEAMARLAQPFNMRIPLIDPMGSVGSQTGDEAAAPRYWESRLTKAAELLVSEVDQKAIKMIPNFDGELMEPVILPVKWPNSLINGTEGIAVGYASKMVSHNPTEIMNAAIKVAKDFDTVTDKDIIKIIKGPDLPTGGEIIGTDEIKNYIETGKGTVVVRGRYTINEMSRGRTQVIFYELPYQVSAEKVISEINRAKDNGKFKEISEAKDLSDLKQGLRLSITIKASANVNNVINELFKSTSVESKIPINNTVLINNAPKQVSILELLKDFIILREDCVINKSNYRSQEIKIEKHRLDGLMKVLLDIDKAIEIIRGSKDDTVANNKLRKAFKIDEEQAKSILSMRLRSLTKSNSHEIEQKIKSLEEEIAHLEAILSNEEELKKEVVRDLEETKKIIRSPRRTTIINKTVDELNEENKRQRQLHSKLDKDIPVKVIVYKDSSLRIDIPGEEITDNNIKSIIDTTSRGELVGLLPDGSLISVPVQGITVEDITESYKECLAFGKQELSKDDYGILVLTNKGNVTVIKGGMKPDSIGVRLEDGEDIIYAKWLTKEEHENSVYVLISAEGKVILTRTKSVKGFNAGSGTVRAMNTDSVIVFAGFIHNEEDVLLAFNDQDEYKATELSQFNAQGRGGSGVAMASGKGYEVVKAEIVSRNNLADIYDVTARARAWNKL